MKLKCIAVSLALLCFGNMLHGQSVEELPHGIKTVVDSTVINLEFYTPSTVRVTKVPKNVKNEKESYSVIAKPQDVKFTTSRSGDNITLKTSKLKVSLNTKKGTVTFVDNKGGLLLKEKDNARFTPMLDAGVPSFNVKQSFILDEDEPIYGLGNYENGKLSLRNFSRRLMPGNIEDGIPVIQSIKGYGIFWDNYSPTVFTDNNEGMTFDSEVGDLADYYFMYGGNADGVIAEMRTLTGSVPMFPLWTYGFWQSRERYKSQNEILEVVDKHRKLGVPIDGIIQDWQYWGNNYLWNAMEFMNPEFNKPQMMVDSIHDMNAHAIISIWSSFGPQTKPYRELDAKGLLFNFSTWPQSGIAEQWPPRMDYPSGVRVYDAYSAEARDIYWNNLKRLFDFGLDGWWMDSTEPDHFDVTSKDMDTKTSLGSFRRVRGAYPLMTVGGVYDHQRATSDDKRVFILTRSGWAGQQRYGCNVWTGDVTSTWDMLRNTVPALLNFSLTGNPNCNSDLGGFFCNQYNKKTGDNSAPKNPLFQELYVRWLQMGAFTPMMRSHGADIFREIYYFGEKGEPIYDAIEDAIRLRYAMLPYIYSTSWQVTNNNDSFLRPLMMDFKADRKAWECNDEFMFGRNILVAPVLNAQYTPEKIVKADENSGWNIAGDMNNESRSNKKVNFMAPSSTEVYLPKGSKWYDFWTNEMIPGGRTIEKATTIKTIPVYVKAGSIMPWGPDVQYATEKPWTDLEIRVYPGADGSFTLYEDENDNYNYEKGMYSTIGFDWDNKSKTLTIGKRNGEFPGMNKERRFNIVLVSETSGSGDKPMKVTKTVAYSGNELKVKL